MPYPLLPFSNAQELHILHPASFEAPNVQELCKLALGDLVKLNLGEERFWLMIIFLKDDLLWGQVENVLSPTQPINLGSVIPFKKEHIYQIKEDSDDENAFIFLFYSELIEHSFTPRLGAITATSGSNGFLELQFANINSKISFLICEEGISVNLQQDKILWIHFVEPDSERLEPNLWRKGIQDLFDWLKRANSQGSYVILDFKESECPYLATQKEVYRAEKRGTAPFSKERFFTV